ncbi:MAG TPA: hypothetical protein VFC14_17755 [Burkholderiales bacterium]|nr:hypothetical protein [Burkholderiales bacterium]
MTIRRLVRVLGVCAVAAPAVLCMTACTTTPPAPPAPSGLTLEVPSATGGFVSATPLIPATTSSAANFFVLPLASTTAPIVRATLSTPYPSELRMTVLDVTRNVTVDLPQLPSGSPMPSTGAFQVSSVTATNPASWVVVIRYPNSFQGSKSIRTFIADVVKGTTSLPLVFNMSFSGARLTVSIVTANNDGKVQSTPPGIDCPPTCSADFFVSAVTLTQSVLHNQTQFTGWTGNCTGSGNSCPVLLVAPTVPPLPANASVTANFRVHTNTPIPAMLCPGPAALVPGKRWVGEPNCGKIPISQGATLGCNASGYFCCGVSGGKPTANCPGGNETMVTCAVDNMGVFAGSQLIQPGGCYVNDP